MSSISYLIMLSRGKEELFYYKKRVNLHKKRTNCAFKINRFINTSWSFVSFTKLQEVLIEIEGSRNIYWIRLVRFCVSRNIRL